MPKKHQLMFSFFLSSVRNILFKLEGSNNIFLSILLSNCSCCEYLAIFFVSIPLLSFSIHLSINIFVYLFNLEGSLDICFLIPFGIIELWLSAHIFLPILLYLSIYLSIYLYISMSIKKTSTVSVLLFFLFLSSKFQSFYSLSLISGMEINPPPMIKRSSLIHQF